MAARARKFTSGRHVLQPSLESGTPVLQLSLRVLQQCYNFPSEVLQRYVYMCYNPTSTATVLQLQELQNAVCYNYSSKCYNNNNAIARVFFHPPPSFCWTKVSHVMLPALFKIPSNTLYLLNSIGHFLVKVLLNLFSFQLQVAHQYFQFSLWERSFESP